MSSSSEPSSGPSPLAPTGRRDDPVWYTRRIELTLYVLAGASYIALGMFNKWLLNWIIGPIWLVAWIWLAPLLIDRYLPRRAA